MVLKSLIRIYLKGVEEKRKEKDITDESSIEE